MRRSYNVFLYEGDEVILDCVHLQGESIALVVRNAQWEEVASFHGTRSQILDLLVDALGKVTNTPVTVG